MKHFRISVRLYALVGLALLTMAAVMMLGLFEEQDKLVAQRKAMLEAMNENAVTVFEAYHKQEQAGTLSQKDAQARAIEAIQAMRYQGNGYFFITDMKSMMIMHPIKPALNGTDQTENKDPTGKHIFVEFSKKVKAEGKGFVDYYWPKPGAEEPVLKYSHVAGFAPWGWIVGTGVYADDLAAMFTEGLIQVAVICGLEVDRHEVRPLVAACVVVVALAERDVTNVVPHLSGSIPGGSA